MDRPSQRQRDLETRMTRVENQMSDLAVRMSDLIDRVDMITHHMRVIRDEGGPVVRRSA